jgi:multiple sugar transport system permease protein
VKKDSIFRHSLLAVLSLGWLFPLYLLILNSFADLKRWDADFDWRYKGWKPLENLKLGWEAATLTPGLKSNFFYGILGAGLSIIFASLAAYAIVALNVKRKALWFWIIYGANLIPYQMLLLPLFEVFASTGLYDTRWGLLVVYIGVAIPFAFFLSRNHMLSIPLEVLEAARLDGASKFRIYRSIYFPLSRSALGAAFLFQFTWIWNDLAFGLTLTTSESVRPLQSTLSTLLGMYGNTPMPVILSANFIASLPTAVLFIVAQRLFVAGLRAGN